MSPADIILATPAAWQRGAPRRLAVAMALGAMLLAALLLLLRFDVDTGAAPELEVRLVPDEEAVAPGEPLAEVMAAPRERTTTLESPPAVSDDAALPEQPAPARDWQTDAVVAAIVAERLNPPSVNPGFDAKRRRAAEQFSPSRAPRKKPIWENVEIDQLGRKILVSGNCHRVIDDPSAANYDIFRTFQQYLVSCSKERTGPRALPWVDEIRAGRDYLAGAEGARTDLYAQLR